MRTVSEGGVACGGGSPVLVNCVIAENDAEEAGGGVSSTHSTPIFTGCTISKNTARRGGGVFNEFGILKMSNCILWDDKDEEVSFGRGGEIEISYSNVQEGWQGSGNIDVDPKFVDLEVDDFRLRAGSPCIDSASIDGPETDLLGHHRPIDIPGVGRDGPGAFDMGAYEFQPPILDPHSDINEDGVIDALDLLILLRDWQKVSGA